MHERNAGSRPSGRDAAIAASLVLTLLAAALSIAAPAVAADQAAAAERASQAPGCSGPQECLEQMTLDEKIGQMTQANHQALTSESDIADYALGSLLAGGGGSPATGNTPEDWADMVDRYQSCLLYTSDAADDTQFV